MFKQFSTHYKCVFFFLINFFKANTFTLRSIWSNLLAESQQKLIIPIKLDFFFKCAKINKLKN